MKFERGKNPMKSMGLGLNYVKFEDGTTYELKDINISIEPIDLSFIDNDNDKIRIIHGVKEVVFTIDGYVDGVKEGKAKIVYETIDEELKVILIGKHLKITKEFEMEFKIKK